MSTMVLARPHPALRPYIASEYQGWSEVSSRPTLRRELPAPIIPLILNFQSPFDIAPRDGPGRRMGSFVAGLSDVFTEVSTTGPSSCIQLNLTPIGARVLFGIPLGPIAGLTISPADALDSPWHRLTADLATLANWSARLGMLEDFLLKRLRDERQIPRQLIGAHDLLARSRGRVRIETIAERTGWSRKHLAAQFEEHFGLTPKRLGRVIRFNRAVSLLSSSPLHPLADLALDCGFADQGHFNREFARLAGCTPTQYLAGISPEGFSPPAV